MEEEKLHKRSPITWVPTAYFAMGLPFVVLNMVTVLMFKGLGVEDKLITFWTSLILLPWTLKPLWSPFLELFKTKKFFVIATQLITGITFGLVAFSLNLPHFFSIAIALLAIIAFSGATHDIACDGVYMSELSQQEQAGKERFITLPRLSLQADWSTLPAMPSSAMPVETWTIKPCCSRPTRKPGC